MDQWLICNLRITFLAMLYIIELSVMLPIWIFPQHRFLWMFEHRQVLPTTLEASACFNNSVYGIQNLYYVEDGRVMQQMAPIYKPLHTQECIYFGLKKIGTLTAIWSTSPVVLLIETTVSWAGFLNLIRQSRHIKVLFAKTTQLMNSPLITVSDRGMKSQNQVPRFSLNLLLGCKEFSEALHSFGTMYSWNQVLVLKNTPRAL